MIYALDSTFFFIDHPVPGEMVTTPAVVGELIDLRSKCRYEVLLTQGLMVQEPPEERLGDVRDAARQSGDAEKLSPADTGLLALALDRNAILLTDDFAIQNVARALSVPVQPLQQRRAGKRIWKYRCSGCGRRSFGPGECRICGSPIKRSIT